MGIFLLTCFTMVAFASNSILTRMAVEGDFIDPFSFALIRVLAGAATLALLVLGQHGRVPLAGKMRVVGAVSLALYMIGFSLAYVSLDAGLGALILFGVVQIAMFLHGVLRGTRPSIRQLTGAAVAFAGLVIVLWPGDANTTSLFGAGAMVLAGLGWAAYSISGKSETHPLAATAGNFCLCFPLLLVVLLPFVEHADITGIGLAVLCGAVTSGLGYALWYRVLPSLQQSLAAVVQLSVPILAILAGAVLLGEQISLSVCLAAALVVSGIGLAATSPPARADRK